MHTRQRISRRLLRHRVHSVRLIRRECLNILVEVLIDHSTHALLTMRSLATVIPERIRIRYLMRKHKVILALFGGVVEAREDSVDATDGLARLIESRLHDAVVGFEEVKFDVVANCCYDVLGLEVQTAVGGGGAGADAVDDACVSAFAGCGGGEAEN